MGSISKAFAVALTVLVASSAPAFAEGDPAKGERVYRKCRACHMVGENAQNRVGPILNDVIGRQAGTIEGYRYSNINKAAGEAGLTWTPENLAAYLPDPQGFLKSFIEEAGGTASGRTKMAFRLRKEEDIADIIAYLMQFSPEAAPAPAE